MMPREQRLLRDSVLEIVDGAELTFKIAVGLEPEEEIDENMTPDDEEMDFDQEMIPANEETDQDAPGASVEAEPAATINQRLSPDIVKDGHASRTAIMTSTASNDPVPSDTDQPPSAFPRATTPTTDPLNQDAEVQALSSLHISPQPSCSQQINEVISDGSNGTRSPSMDPTSLGPSTVVSLGELNDSIMVDNPDPGTQPKAFSIAGALAALENTSFPSRDGTQDRKDRTQASQSKVPDSHATQGTGSDVENNVPVDDSASTQSGGSWGFM